MSAGKRRGPRGAASQPKEMLLPLHTQTAVANGTFVPGLKASLQEASGLLRSPLCSNNFNSESSLSSVILSPTWGWKLKAKEGKVSP